MRMSRVVAFLLLLTSVFARYEAVWGEMRDGAVHHESVAAAAGHAVASHGDHGHEDPGTSAGHGEGHEHGTGSDHCTHPHGTSVPAAALPSLPLTFTSLEIAAERISFPGCDATGFFVPPRA